MMLREVTPEMKAHYRALGIWGDLNFAEYFDARANERPQQEAIVDHRGRLSYGELQRLSQRLALALLERGVRSGDMVAVQAPNWREHPLLNFTLNRIGAIYMPLHESWRQTEVGHLLRLAQAKMLIVARSFHGFDYLPMVEELRPGLPELREVIVIGGMPGYVSLEELLERPRETEHPADYLRQFRDDPDLPTNIMISSGTTSLPKASVWTANNLFGLVGYQFPRAIRLVPEDRAAALAPMSTGATGYVFPVLAPLLAGATTLLLEHFEAEAALALLERERATYATAVPAQMIKLLDTPALARTDLSAFARFNNAGAPLPQETAKGIEEQMGCIVQSVYGATDAGVPTLTTIDDPPAKRYTTVGRLQVGQEMRLVDDDYRDVAPGEVGEIIWRGAAKTYGYLNDPKGTAAAFSKDGWYLSGDLGVLDADGYLRIVGRKKDMIIRGGQNISPREIEELLIAHPKVADVAVASMPHRVLGEKACAFVVVRQGERFTFDEMIKYLKAQKLAIFKLPERLETLEELPRSAGGKIAKNRLTELVTSKLKEEGAL